MNEAVSCSPRAAACTIAQADQRLANDPRFLTEAAEQHGRAGRQWVHGPRTIADLLTLYHQHGDLEFVVHGAQRSTYRGAVLAIAAAAQALLAAGLRRGDRLALVLRNCPEWPVWFLGAIAAGGIAVPLHGRDSSEQIAWALADCGARFLVCDRADLVLPDAIERVWTVGPDVGAWPQTLAMGSEQLLGPPQRWAQLTAVDQGLPPADPDEVGAIFYTSGTTARPKGATITQRALTATIKNTEYNAARALLRFPPLPDAPPPPALPPVALFPVPFFHVTGAIPGLIACSALGVRIVVMRKWDVGQALAIIAAERVTLLGGVPTMPLQLLADPRCASHDLSSLGGLIYGGAPAPRHLPAAIAAGLHAEAATGWGMTETASTVLHHSGPDYRLRPASCGVAVPVNAARIADAADLPLAAGEIGELQVRGLNVMHGYWNRPEASLRAFTQDGWLRTGDIAWQDEEGFVTIVDRAKDVIIRGGENIACIEIESVLAGHAGVVEAAVVGRAHATLGEEPVAFVTLAPESWITGAALKAFAAQHLPQHKVPVEIFAAHEPLAHNQAGKVVKDPLRRRVAAAMPGGPEQKEAGHE